MAYQCKKCDHPAFDTSGKLKNHSRTHAQACNVKFPSHGHGPHEEVTLHRGLATNSFTCCRCLRYESKFPAKMQLHCKTCTEVEWTADLESDSDSGPQSVAPLLAIGPSVPGADGRGSYISSELGFFVNERLHVAICRQCQYWVDVGSIAPHATRLHAHKVDLDRLLTDVDAFQLKSGIHELAQYAVGTAALKEPVAGLRVEDGFGCMLCIFYCRRLETLKVHLRTAHGSNCSVPDSHRVCSVQRLSKSPGNNSWFGVRPPSGGPGPVGGKNLLLDIVTRDAEERRQEVFVAPYKDARQLPMFMKRLNWDYFIESMAGDVVAMAPLVSAHGQGDARFSPDRLREVCRSLMTDFQRNIGTAESLLRRKVKSTKAGDISTAPFSRLEQSCEDYVATLLHLIIVLLRSLDSENADDDAHGLLPILVPLGEPDWQSLRCLWDGLRPVGGDGRFAEEQLGASKCHCIRLLEDLFFLNRPSHLIPETSFLVYRFVVFAAIQHRHVLTPGDVTHRISRMMYWCRSLVLHKIVNTPISDDAGDADEAEARSLSFVRDDNRTPFAAMVEAKRLIFAVTKNETLLPNVVWVGDGQIVDGIVVDIQGVSTMIRDSIKELYVELRRDLLLGMPAYHSNKDSILRSKSGGGLEDNLRDNRAGHWFISNTNNHCSGYSLCLVHHIVSDAALCSRFVAGVEEQGPGTEIVWNRDALGKWVQKVGRWLQKLLSVAHLVSGQPARGVEFLQCATRNTPAQIRGVYYVDGLVMLLSLYGKADNVRGAQQPVARFLCKDTSFLLINYLTYVREMEVVASKVLHDPEQTALYNQLLAVRGGRAMGSRELSEGMSGIFLKHLKVSVPLGSWRHMAIAWMHRFLKYTNIEDLTGNGAVDSQAGHSQRLASKCYGRSNFDHPSIGRDELQLYRLVSVEWHRILRLLSDALPVAPPGGVLRNAARLGRPAGTQESGNRSDGVEADSAEVSTTTTAEVHHHHHHEIKVVQSAGDVGIDFPSLACSESALRGLLALGYTEFKSSEQAKAVHRILERQEDLLVVLPTGGGKTLLFLLPAAVESGRYTTVVICPLVALRNEMVRRAREAKISVQVYSESTTLGGADILLASVEHCLSPAFQNHVAQLHGEGRLGRIVVDECHLALTATSWRPALQDMEHIRKVPVPLLLLSGTVPPHMEDPLKRFFNSHLSVVRRPTTRPNMTYEVRKDHGPLDARLVTVLSSGATTPKSIVFSRGREQTGILAALLRTHGLTAVHYHGQMDEESKDAAHRSWAGGEADVMVATGAFGTGVDFGAVRLVVHMDQPYSMIDLAQESGRGGRDGSASKHVVLLPTFWKARVETCTKLAEYLSGSKCRRWVLQEYLDGRGLDCFSSGSARCDVCESLAGRVQACVNAADPWETAAGAADLWSHDMDPFAITDGDTSGSPGDRESRTKRVCTGDALLSGSATGTRQRHASQALVLLDFVQYLQGAKGKCIVCTIGQQPSENLQHFMRQCPYVRDVCLKCLGNTHGASNCPNWFPWRGNQCYGCGLPNKLGQQVMHPERFGTGCQSIGHDKILPACWFLWRNSRRFTGVFVRSGCPPDIRDPQFAEWLTDEHETYRWNAIHLFIVYVQSTLE